MKLSTTIKHRKMYILEFKIFLQQQVEGAPSEDGKGLSNWDVFSHTPGK